MDTFKKLRKAALTSGVVVTAGIIAFLLLKEFATSPVTEPTSITSNTPPHATAPPPEVKADYSVPSDYPKHLLIPKLDINTNVVAVGKTKEGAIDAPHTAWEAGWYTASSKPGSGSGALLIDGHVNDSLNSPGVFYELGRLSYGDEVTIERGDGAQLVYKVVAVNQQPLAELDMKKALHSAEAGKEGLNLITCGGHYDKKTATYSDRVVVYAVSEAS